MNKEVSYATNGSWTLGAKLNSWYMKVVKLFWT